MKATSARVTHFDTIDVRFDASSMVEQVDGTWIVDGEGAHVGPYTYHDDQGRPFIEHVPASTLFEQASLDSAAGTTVTIRHGPGLVTPDRYRKEAHGAWVKAWEAPGAKLGVRLRVASADAITFIKDAIARDEGVELSPVYEVDVVEGQDDEQAAQYGQHHAVQRDRRYSGIAILGQDEARGGPSTALKLDSNTKAPTGCRAQVGGPRLDSAPPAPLHSATGRSNTMKHAIIRSDGFKPRTITAQQLAGIRTITSKDAIETGTVTIAIEGEETSELVLPTSMIEMLLEGIGASSAPPVEEPPAMEEEQLEALDMGDDPDKLDAKTVTRMIADSIAAHERKRTVSDARDSSVHRDAATILPPIYDFTVPWPQVALDAIAKASPEQEDAARKLAADAATNPVHEGMLRQMLAALRREPESTGSSMSTPKKDSDNDAKPWLADTMPTGAEQ